jgi:hypothetical protein
MNEMSTFLPEKKWKPGPELQANQVYRIIQIDQNLLRRVSGDIAQFKKDSAS